MSDVEMIRPKEGTEYKLPERVHGLFFVAALLFELFEKPSHIGIINVFKAMIDALVHPLVSHNLTVSHNVQSRGLGVAQNGID